MEMEFFVKPGEDEEWHQYWIDERTRWYVDLGIDPDNLRHYEHPKEKLSHYAKRTVDIEYRFGFAGSRVGRARGHREPHRLRPDHALRALRARTCPTSTRPADERYMPYVIEPAAGLDRAHDGVPASTPTPRTRRRTPRAASTSAPCCGSTRGSRRSRSRCCRCRRNADLSPEGPGPGRRAARHGWNVDFDDSGAIGRRYRRQDEIGTPYCVTVDFDTLEDHAVTVRERDSMKQERIALDQVQRLLRRAPARLLTPTGSGTGRAGVPCPIARPRVVHNAACPAAAACAAS